MTEVDPNRYWEDRLQAQFDLVGVGYEGLGLNFNRWLYRVRRHVFLRRVRQLGLDFRGLTVLDVGSGTGFYVDRWRELGVESIAASDMTRSATDRLRRRYPDLTVFTLDIGGETEDVPREGFDVVSAFDVLLHIVDDRRYERAFENVAALLRPGGVFLFSDNFTHGRRRVHGTQVDRPLSYTERVAERAGFSIVARHPMFVLMNSPVDYDGLALRAWWEAIRLTASAHEAVAFVIGALLFPLELALVSLLRESPTTEMMICRKPATNPRGER